jgi:hypothetical protein
MLRRLWAKWLGKDKDDRPAWVPPISRRVKSYQSENGLSFSYVAAGSRETSESFEYRFDLTGSGQIWQQSTVELPKVVLRAWCAERSRNLNTTERYAFAKVLFLRALDNTDETRHTQPRIRANMQQLREAAEILDFN